MRDIFAAELRLTWQFFPLERGHARALNELARLGTFVPFLFLLLFSHVCVPTKNSTVLHLPLSRRINTAGALKDPKLKQYCTYHYTWYTTSTYNSKTAVQYHMIPIYNSTVPYIHRSAPKSHTFLTALRSTLAARDLYCTPGTSINCPYISTLYRRYIYFYAASTASGHRWSPAATIYIFYAGIPTS